MSRAFLNGFDCHFEYEDFGHRDIIVFSHSLGTDLHMWARQVDLLSHQFNVLRYDTRGHGESGCAPSAFDLADLGRDVVALLDVLKIQKPVYFCGLSLGGLVGQWLAIHEPRRLKRLILANTAAKIGSDTLWTQRIELVTDEGLEGLRESSAQRWFTEEFRKNQPEVVTAILSRFAQTNPKEYAKCCATIRDADFRNELRQLQVPTLLISGDKDPVTTIADAEFMAQRIPNVRHVTLPAAHLSNVEKADEFAKVILSFAEQ